MSANGLTTIASRHAAQETLDRLEATARAKGMTIFARIDHAAGAAEVGLSLRPTTVVIFGTAKAGTALMQANQTIGIDLPLKALVWQDEQGKTWMSYNETAWLAERHALGPRVSPAIEAIAAALATVAGAATE